ncbi:DUF3566 domain-containing protein [Amycolatopsis jejuensis]|uniref:DUF3566 domain-containing protein n=1 Tax=Amycolatopsis jejuensis TaxID=330084 RepID=UPI0005278C89|nr:DUF3566 domain-containing protein [Amycolatopsis jejuensis]
MAPSDKADGDTAANPPWQRTAKDGGGDPEAMATARIATEDVVHQGHEQGPAGFGEQHDYPVSGTAAPRLFGAEVPPAATSAEVPAAGRTRPTPSALRRPGRGPRRASLQIKRFDPWSVLKLALVLGVAMFFVWLVAVGVLYTVLDGMGVWDKLNGTYSSLVGGEGANASPEPLISAGRVFGIAAILGAINIVLVSALATVSAFIYNVSADLAGGLEVTLSERE